MTPSRGSALPALLALAAGLVLAGAALPAAAAPPAVAVPAAPTAATAAKAAAGAPGDNLARIAELQRQGRVAEALALCRRETAARPDDPRLLYNQACLENRSGDARAALRSLRAAFARGFDDFAFALADPDLQGALADSTRALVGAQRQQRGRLSAARGARLRFGKPATLHLQTALPPAADAGTTPLKAPVATPVATLTVTWVPTGLELRLTGDDRGNALLPRGDACPWTGHGGLVVLLGDIAVDGTGETNDSFVLGFGIEKGAGSGAVFVAETGRWQRVRELTPKLRGAGTADLALEVTVPWTAISPYHPLTEGALGLNVVLATPAGGAKGALVPDDILGRVRLPRHLAARLDFDLATAPAGLLQGRTPTTLVTGGSLAINLAATSAGPGEGRLMLDFQDSQGHSLLAGGAQPQAVTLAAGLNALNRAVDFSRLPDGPCRLSASLDLPQGGTAAWAQWVLNLGPDWEARYRAAIARMPAAEQPTARRYLQAVGEAVAAHRDRRDPGPLTTTLGDLNLMLGRCRETGTLIPAEGLTPFVYPGPDGADRLCRLVVPVGRPAGARLVPLVLAGHDAVDGPRLADRILRFLAEAGGAAGTAAKPAAAAAGSTWPVFVVAPGPGEGDGDAGIPGGADEAALKGELDACLRWTRDHYGADRVRLAAQGWAVAPALALARGPVGGADLLVFADKALQPWPGAAPADLDRRLGPPPAGLIVTWVDFVQETALNGQARALRDALRRLAWRVDDERVPGSTNFTQVADRVCRWQSSLDAAPVRAVGPQH
jgi:hypothetical protein